MEPLKLLFLSKDENPLETDRCQRKAFPAVFLQGSGKRSQRIWSSAEETRSESILNSMHFICAEDNELGRETPIIAMTANAFVEDVNNSLARE